MKRETIDFLQQCSLAELAEILTYILERNDCSVTLASDKRGMMFTVPPKPVGRFAGINGLCIDVWLDIDVAELCSVSCAKNGDDVSFEKTKLNSFAVVKETDKPAKKKGRKP